MNAQDNNAYNQAVAQANSIFEMVGALNVDYERLEELKEEKQAIIDSLKEAETHNSVTGYYNDCEGVIKFREELHQWEAEYGEELQELMEAANGNTSEDEAREAVQNDALDVQVRGEWHTPGETHTTPSEFQILLCTGGPAVRIMGELDDNCEPCRAWIEYQDWGTPWTHAVGIIDQDTLLQYCQQFYFGE